MGESLFRALQMRDAAPREARRAHAREPSGKSWFSSIQKFCSLDSDYLNHLNRQMP
ncbi:hypothetical protein [Burkholderia sp. S-53]|uniref:hypothetical protein n=1 Tax=Burkholderia sp. S-53 TaxID=2906514 RepID=UPI0021D045CD|nr:hypothetical protein [Burkholderia sp. S-53]UXU85449.1 hypothetical protein LXM88_03570 [Burkholderia sp. S-53]